MKIKLKGILDLDLIRIGLFPGDIIHNATLENETTGCVHFDHFHVINNHCSVWPQNYDIIKDDKPKLKVEFTIT